MEVSFADFLQQMTSSPALLITVLLTLGVIFVNGWTDAPNAIATCITTRCMNVRSAIWLSAVFNFLGVFVMTQINSSVASTISNMVDFGGDTREALIALCAALFSIVVYSVGASYFGIPTSESHSLIAGLSGAAIECYGIVGMAAKNVKDGLVQLLKLESLTKGIKMRIDANKVSIDLHIIVEYGTNISAIADNIISTVKYSVEEFTGVEVEDVNIFVDGVRVDN